MVVYRPPLNINPSKTSFTQASIKTLSYPRAFRGLLWSVQQSFQLFTTWSKSDSAISQTHTISPAQRQLSLQRNKESWPDPSRYCAQQSSKMSSVIRYYELREEFCAPAAPLVSREATKMEQRRAEVFLWKTAEAWNYPYACLYPEQTCGRRRVLHRFSQSFITKRCDLTSLRERRH